MIALARPHAKRKLPRKPSSKLHVLVIEDHVDLARSLSDLLTMYGYDVEIRFDGPSGVEAAHARVPDVVLLDIRLPGMSGYEVAKRLTRFAKRPMIIAMTGLGREVDLEHSEKAGIDLHLVKPVEPEQLKLLLERFQEIVIR